jgi:hypothetical protein
MMKRGYRRSTVTEKTDAADSRQGQGDFEPEHLRIPQGGDLQADTQEVRQEEGRRPGDSGRGIPGPAQQEVRIDGVVRAVFHQFVGHPYGYIVVQIPDHWEAYGYTYHPEDGKTQLIVDVRRRG